MVWGKVGVTGATEARADLARCNLSVYTVKCGKVGFKPSLSGVLSASISVVAIKYTFYI